MLLAHPRRAVTLLAIPILLAGASVIACGGGGGGETSDGGSQDSDAAMGADAGQDGSSAPTAPTAPTFTPSATVQNNDFLLAMSSSAGASICFTLDGSDPVCQGGGCGGTSQTYSAATRVSIDGSVTDASGATKGEVRVAAVACAAGTSGSTITRSTYTLSVATPILSGVKSGANAYAVAGVSGTFTDATLDSTSPTNPVTLHVTTGTTAPSCADAHALGKGVAVVTAQTAQEVQAIGCKLGYADSAVDDEKLSFSLNPPGITGGAFYVLPTLSQGTSPGPGVVVDLGNAGSNDTLCATIDSSTPVCAASGACQTGGTTLALANVVVGNAVSSTTTVNLVACAPPGLQSSSVATAGFTLQFAPLIVSTVNALPAPGAVPGWAATTTGAITTSQTIDPGAPIPWGPLTLFSIENRPCTSNDLVGPGAGNCSNTPPYELPDFVCWAKNAAATCPTSGSCSTAAGGQIVVPAGGAQLPASADVGSGDTLSVVGCQAAAAAIVWGGSVPTNVTFH